MFFKQDKKIPITIEKIDQFNIITIKISLKFLFIETL